MLNMGLGLLGRTEGNEVEWQAPERSLENGVSAIQMWKPGVRSCQQVFFTARGGKERMGVQMRVGAKSREQAIG